MDQPEESECEVESEYQYKSRQKDKLASREIKAERQREVKDFAECLLKVLEEYTTQQDQDYLLFLGVPQTERNSASVEYPLYQQSQACYAINKLIEKTGIIHMKASYADGERSAPDFSDIEIKRDHYEMLLVNGKIFFEWKGMKCIASLYFQGNYAEAHFLYAKKDWKKMKKFQKALRKFMYEHNYFRGEKLEYLPYSKIGFLKYPKMDWKALILKQRLKDEIDLNLIFPLYNKKLCKKHNIPWRRGVLLAGIPGTGKTQLGRVLCNVLDGITVLWATCKAVHDTGRVRKLFEIARKLSPTLIVLEDLDFFGHDREFITNPVVGELLNQLDGSTPNEGVFVLATTNRPHLLDRALADRPSRFDVKLLFEVPEIKERRAMIELFSEGKIMEVKKEYIAQVTNKLTGSHIKEVINYATLLALKNGDGTVKKEHIDKALVKIKDKLTKIPEFKMVS